MMAGIGGALQSVFGGSGPTTYRPTQAPTIARESLGAAPQVSTERGGAAGTAAIEQQRQQAATGAAATAAGMASGTGGALARRQAIMTGGGAQAQIGGQAVGAQLNYQQALEQAQRQAQLANANLTQNRDLSRFTTLQGSNIQQAGMQNQANISAQNLTAQSALADQNAGNQMGASALGGLASGVGSGLMLASDERIKEDVRPVSGREVGEALAKVPGKSFRYKAETGLPTDERTGVMAQDLEREAPELVRDGEDGKAIDVGKALGALLASHADLYHRIKSMEHRA